MLHFQSDEVPLTRKKPVKIQTSEVEREKKKKNSQDASRVIPQSTSVERQQKKQKREPTETAPISLEAVPKKALKKPDSAHSRVEDTKTQVVDRNLFPFQVFYLSVVTLT